MALLVCGLGLLLCHYPILLSGFRTMHGELGDTRFVHYVIEHSYLWLTGAPLQASYWDPPMFLPALNTLAYSDIMLGAAPLYWPWRLLGFLPDTAFQLWQLSVSALNFAMMHLLLRRGLRFSVWASALGAFLFAFGAPRLVQAGHFQLYAHFATPLCIYALVALFRAPEARARRALIALAIGAAVLQLYAAFYLGWFLILGLFVLGVWALVLPGPRRALMAQLKQHWRTVLVGGALGVLALLPMVLHYGAAVRELGGLRSFTEALLGMPRLASWFYMGGHSWLYGWADMLPPFLTIPSFYRYEHPMGIGLVTLGLTIAGLVLGRRETAVRLAALVLVTLLLVTVVLPGDVTLWRLFFKFFPGAQAIRGLTRVSLLLLVPAGVGLAWCLDRLGRTRYRAFVPLLLVVCMVEQGQRTLSYDKLADRAEIQWLAQQVPSHCDNFFFTPVHGARPFYKYQIDAIWASLVRGIPTLNGYSGNVPPGYLWVWDNTVTRPEDFARIEAFLERWPRERNIRFDKTCWVRTVPSDSALTAAPKQLDVERGMLGGQRYPVRLVFQNTGTSPWVPGHGFALGTRLDERSPWGLHRVSLPREVPPGGEVTFEFEVQAPRQPGAYAFQWQMLQEGVQWFGQPSESLEVAVRESLPAGGK